MFLFIYARKAQFCWLIEEICEKRQTSQKPHEVRPKQKQEAVEDPPDAGETMNQKWRK